MTPPNPKKQWAVYILLCGDGSLYTGISNDVATRVTQHQSGKGAKYTRARGPLQLVYQETAADRSTATKRELAIKKLKRSEKIQLCDL